MEDEEFDKCDEELKRLLKKDKYGKFRMDALIEILQWAFRQGYEFATTSNSGEIK